MNGYMGSSITAVGFVYRSLTVYAGVAFHRLHTYIQFLHQLFILHTSYSFSDKVANEETISVGSKGSGGTKLSRREQLRSELDDLIASECVFCGDIMVKSIDKPFIADEDFDRVLAEWL